MTRFDYLIAKIEAEPFVDVPFMHIEIKDLFEPNDFIEILAASEITLPAVEDDSALFDCLFENGYKIIPFPGSTASRKEYLDWHRMPAEGDRYHPTCEGFGVTLRLIMPKSTILKELDAFLRSEAFNSTLARKFRLDLDSCTIDCGIQKYLDGYEISPHPDTRDKALTYMVNVNSNPISETLKYHTHYMRFKPERAYVKTFWASNPDIQRCWVPWSWCQTDKMQVKNNSIVIFSPNNHTLHAIKAAYNHLTFQRTQLYGNLWYKERKRLPKADWTDLDICQTMEKRLASTDPKHLLVLNKMASVLPEERELVTRKML